MVTPSISLSNAVEGKPELCVDKGLVKITVKVKTGSNAVAYEQRIVKK